MNHLIYFYLNFYRETPKEKQTVILELIDKNIKMLQKYLDNSEYDDDNHGLIQARSSLNYVAAFPLAENKTQILEASLLRIEKNATNMFSQTDGLSVEQAIDYHYIGTSMFIDAKKQISRLDVDIPTPIYNTLNRAIEVGAYLLFDDGAVPAIGDTYYNNKWDVYLKRYYDLFDTSNVMFDEYLINGQSALDDLKILTDAGLIIAKKRNLKNNLSKVFFDVGKKRTVHGHFDNLNIILLLDGDKLLVDSGGPYVYSSPGRGYFWSLPAHNSLVINNQVDNTFDAVIDNSSETDTMLTAAGTQKTTDQIDHRRAFALLKSNTDILLVIDQVIDASGGNNTIKDFWHFPPETMINSIDDQRSILTLENKHKFLHFQYSLNPTSCDTIIGEFDNNNLPKLGWVTAAYYVATPAPVKVCTSEDKNYIKINVFSNELELNPQIEDFADHLIISIMGNVLKYDKSTNKITVI